MRTARNGFSVILVEDDLEVGNYLDTALQCQGYSVQLVQEATDALNLLRLGSAPVSAVVLDVDMPRGDGLGILTDIRLVNRDIPVILLTGTNTSSSLDQSLNDSATRCINKPVKPADLRDALASVLSKVSEPAARQESRPAQGNPQVFFGISPRIVDLQKLIAQIGWSEAPVLIRGETGVGKEVFARELHASSPRAKQTILKLNCAALPSELVESELFGYERGAFTGAFQRKLGMFELADGGTILLDEIGDMDVRLQAKLLQVLQDHEFQRLGGKTCTSVNVRVIAATHRNLEQAIAAGNFREDLFYRLNVISVKLPALRERKEDLLAMAEFLLRKHAPKGSAPLTLPAALQELFLEYNWPGNVRELENVIRKFVIFGDARVIEADLRSNMPPKPVPCPAPVEQSAMPPAAPQPETQPAPVPAALKSATESKLPALMRVAEEKREAERSLILAALESTNWHRNQAAVALQIDYKALLYKMKILAIKKEKAATPKRSNGEARRQNADSSALGASNGWHHHESNEEPIMRTH